MIMSSLAIQHTRAIFERLAETVPPLVPQAIRADLKQALEQVESNDTLTLEEVEATVLSFGKRLWPYRRAFDEFYDLSESELAELFLLQRLPPKMKKRYQEFLAHGGSFQDLRSGHPAMFFSIEERMKLCEILVDVSTAIRGYTKQRVASTERQRYEERIVEFQTILEDMEKRLDTLRQMAEDEQEHPDLAAEIRAQIRAFEQGLCLLGPNTSYDAVCRAEEHVVGRKVEKHMHRLSRAHA